MPRRFDELPKGAQRALRRRDRLRYSKSCRRPHIGKVRERQWVDAFFPVLVNALAARALEGKRLFKYEINALGAVLLPRTGWRLNPAMKHPRNNASIAMRKVDELLQLPRIQNALEEKFNKAGLTMDDCTQIVSDIARGVQMGTKQVVVKLQEGYELVDVPIVPEVKDRLAAVDLRVRMTTGYAPTKSAQLNANVNLRQDKFYDQKEFERVPEVALDADFTETRAAKKTGENGRRRSRPAQ